jgi:hypothetical protein
MDARGYPTRFMKALAISIIAALSSGMAVPASAMPNMPHLFAKHEVASAAAMLLMPASMTGTEIALAAIPAMPAATATGSAPPGIGNRADKLEGWGLKPAKALGLTSRSHLSAPT